MNRFISLTAAALLMAGPAYSQQNAMADVEIRTEQLAPGVAVLFGRGGNIGVSHGADGTVLIDDQFAPLTGRIQAAITDLGADPVRFLINTHWHGDHTGGNENFGESGALIMAHDNVRIRLIEGMDRGEGNLVAPAPDAALPVITYHDGVTLHLNGDTVRILHMHNGHTDGDSIIRWENANVIHMGDLFFNGGTFPYIDRQSGGSVQGLIQAATRVLDMADDETRIIPGHGPMAMRTDLLAYRDMLVSVSSQVQAAIDAGLSLDEIQAMDIPAAFNLEGGFISGEQFVGVVHASLTGPDAMMHSHGDEGEESHHDEGDHGH